MNRRGPLPAAGALCAALALALGLTACGAGDDADGDGFLPAGEQARTLALPFDEHTLSPFEMRTLRHAEDLLVRDCMRAHGMDWDVLPAPDEDTTDPPHRRRYGVIEARVAERHGYGPAPRSADEALLQEIREGRESLPATEYRAAHGDEGGAGCLQEAQEDLMAGVPDMDENLLNSYIHTAFEASKSDPSVVDAFADWSACMAERGLDHPTPAEAEDDPRWADREGDPSAAEIEVATADVACKDAASVVEVWRDAEAAAQDGLIEEHTADFAHFARVKEERTERARAVIERSAP